jgi:peptide chain release factor 1
MAMLDKLEEVADRFREVEGQLSDPRVLADQGRFRALSKEHADLSGVVAAYHRLCKVRAQAAGSQELLKDSDPEVRDMARAELDDLAAEATALEQELKLLLLPRDPNDNKNVILEIRAGTGGNEAALFAGDLFRMYTRYAERQGWKVEILSAADAEIGGFKEVIALVSGQGVYSQLKFESGTHRVQRVPETEAQGRIHTSACTVAVLPEAY